jgi:hypothetical protein
LKNLRKNNKYIKDIIQFCKDNSYEYTLEKDELSIKYTNDTQTELVRLIKELLLNPKSIHELMFTDIQSDKTINIFDRRL